MFKRGTERRTKTQIGEHLDFTGAIYWRPARPAPHRPHRRQGPRRRLRVDSRACGRMHDHVPSFPVAETEKLRGDILTAIQEDRDDTRPDRRRSSARRRIPGRPSVRLAVAGHRGVDRGDRAATTWQRFMRLTSVPAAPCWSSSVASTPTGCATRSRLLSGDGRRPAEELPRERKRPVRGAAADRRSAGTRRRRARRAHHGRQGAGRRRHRLSRAAASRRRLLCRRRDEHDPRQLRHGWPARAASSARRRAWPTTRTRRSVPAWVRARSWSAPACIRTTSTSRSSARSRRCGACNASR